ncbi:type II restriction endonuclease [Staphylococcus coagulans]|uniref:type II restriction endonuclease n=1 Tax=Staphylococcus coagulans TaxID=74706 RepID=UPI002870BD69|nr:type II restriction endonuclease [Staphylococcus coagulans]MDR9833585.1 type II restriction endonuclease [Staphylococcus coagulans]
MYNFDNFITDLDAEISNSNPIWDIKGLIDETGKVYSLGTDTKLIGRVFELVIAPSIKSFCDKNNFDYIIPKGQNIYPDFTIGYTQNNEKRYIAIDIKTTYLQKNKKGIAKKFNVTLGSFNSFMRNNTKNICFPYDQYTHHFVIGFIYERNPYAIEGQVAKYDSLGDIIPPYINSKYFIQEKYKISGDKPGSGNTENIGSFKSNNINDFIDGNGPFSVLGKDLFEIYWQNYPRTRSTKHYSSLPTFFDWLKNEQIYKKEEVEQFEELYNSWKNEHPNIL